jgi:hypothetical protein
MWAIQYMRSVVNRSVTSPSQGQKFPLSTVSSSTFNIRLSKLIKKYELMCKFYYVNVSRHVANNYFCSLFVHCQTHFRQLTGVRSTGLKLSGLETGLSPPSNAWIWYRYPKYLYNIMARTNLNLPSFLLLHNVREFSFLWMVFSISLFLE